MEKNEKIVATLTVAVAVVSSAVFAIQANRAKKRAQAMMEKIDNLIVPTKPIKN